MRIDEKLPYRCNYLHTQWLDWGESVKLWCPDNSTNKEFKITDSQGYKIIECVSPCYIEVTNE